MEIRHELGRLHLITVCAVLRNDRDIIETFVERASSLLAAHFELYEILLVDNASSDGSAALVAQLQETVPNLRLVRLSQIYSAETALTAALDNSIGDLVVVLEPRYDDVTLLIPLLQRAFEGYDIVVVRQDGHLRYHYLDRWFGELAYRVAGQIIGQPVHVQDSRYRAYSRRAVNALAQIRRKRRYLKYANSLIGYHQSYINAPAANRQLRKPVRRLEAVSLVIDMVVSNSGAPLRVTSLIGLFASFSTVLYIAYILIINIVSDHIVEGWLTTNIVMASMFFMLFLVLTILSEYIARILDETKDEPLYFVESESTSKVAPYTRVKQQADAINVVRI